MEKGSCLARVEDFAQEDLVFLSSRFGREFVFLEDGAKDIVENALVGGDGWLWINFDQFTGIVKEVFPSWVAA